MTPLGLGLGALSSLIFFLSLPVILGTRPLAAVSDEGESLSADENTVGTFQISNARTLARPDRGTPRDSRLCM